MNERVMRGGTHRPSKHICRKDVGGLGEGKEILTAVALLLLLPKGKKKLRGSLLWYLVKQREPQKTHLYPGTPRPCIKKTHPITKEG